MTRVINDAARQYVAKLDELENVDRQLRGVQPLLDKKAALEGEIRELLETIRTERVLVTIDPLAVELVAEPEPVVAREKVEALPMPAEPPSEPASAA